MCDEQDYPPADWNEIQSGDVPPPLWYDLYGWRYDNSFDEVAALEASPIPRHGGLPITGRDLLDEPVLPGDRR